VPPQGSDACHGGGKAITLADRGGHDEPEVALAAVAAGGIQNACLLQVNHHGVDGAFVAAGVHAHGANQVAAGHRAVVDQVGADRGADDGGEHRSGVVNWVYCSRSGVGLQPPIGLCLSVSVKPFALLAGFGVAAVCLCLLQGQTTLDNLIPLLKVGGIGADDVVEGHRLGCLVACEL